MTPALRCAATLLLLALLPGAAHAKVFSPATFTLKNGLQVVVVSNRRAPIVSQMLWYKAGAADEPAGKSGIAHYLEHLMFKGTLAVGPGEFSKRIAAEGGEDNAFTSWDYTAYYQAVAADRLQLVMQMEADRMANLLLREQEAKPELEVVLAERGQRTENDPDGRFSEAMVSAIFTHHPYGTPVIGWRKEIEKLNAEDARTFYRTWYTPGNAVLIISGDVTADKVRRLAEETYGQIPARAVPARARLAEPKIDAEKRVILRDSEVLQPTVQRVYTAPSWHDSKEDSIALEVLENILADGEVGRFYKNLVVNLKLAAGVDARYQGSMVDHGTFTIAATPQGETPPEKLEQALNAEIKALTDNGVSDAEVADAKLRLQRSAMFARDSLTAPGYSFGIALTTGRTVEDVENWPAMIGAVTAAQVNKSLRALFAQTGFTTGFLLPDPNAKHETAAASGVSMPAQGAIR
ncbi:MAG: insulinase family protein [Alphaproteobacteria bacterium]|nr:insulinase family protein [Alphaproteobacteria bacterium]